MKKPFLLAFAPLVLLAACSSTPPTEFTIESRALDAAELPLDSFGKTSFAARTFDVVNQDLSAENNTGIAGKVQPMPVDALSAYAAKKFKAVGGPYATRLVIKKGSLNVSSVEQVSKGWLFDTTNYKAEMRVNLAASLAASRTDGATATVNAETTQSQQLSLNTSPAERRKVYMELLARALQALDGELNKQLAKYFDEVVAR